MTRPVRPIALVILTLCMIYPGVTLLWQGLVPFGAGEYFMLVGQLGPWMDLAHRLGIPPAVPLVLKAIIGLMWIGGVIGLWAGDPPLPVPGVGKMGGAYPMTLGAAALSLLCPVGPTIMGLIALVCLLGFRENPAEVPA